MGKKKNFSELVNLLVVALRHKIGSIVNKNEIYAQKYAKDSETFMNEAKKTARKRNWNKGDKKMLEQETRKRLYCELAERDFLDNRKFEIMDEEIRRALKELGLTEE